MPRNSGTHNYHDMYQCRPVGASPKYLLVTSRIQLRSFVAWTNVLSPSLSLLRGFPPLLCRLHLCYSSSLRVFLFIFYLVSFTRFLFTAAFIFIISVCPNFLTKVELCRIKLQEIVSQLRGKALITVSIQYLSVSINKLLLEVTNYGEKCVSYLSRDLSLFFVVSSSFTYSHKAVPSRAREKPHDCSCSIAIHRTKLWL